MGQKIISIRRKRNNWREIVLVCRKCSKRQHGGFGKSGRIPLGKALRRFLGLEKGRRAEIGFVDADCFKICPKNAVTVALGSEPGALHVVPTGAPLEDIVVALKLHKETRPPAPAEPHIATPDGAQT